MVTEATRIRTKQPEVRRDQLLDSAEKLFAEKGYAETTVADIADAAGVAKGTFYLYFPSKEHCVIALGERLARGMGDRFLAILDPALEQMERGQAPPVEEVITSLIDESFSYAVEHAQTFRNLFHRPDTPLTYDGPDASEEALIAGLAWALTRMNELGYAQVTHPPHTARILFMGIHWALDHIACAPSPSQAELADLREAAIEVCLRSIETKQPPRGAR